MIKRYNQFVKETKTNEEYEYYTEVDTPVLPNLEDEEKTPIEKTDTIEIPEFKGEEEEVATDKYEVALQSLADLAGVEFNSGDKSVTIEGKEVTYPAETEKYHIKGTKKSFNTPEDVLANLGGSQNVPSERKEEVKDEMSSIKDEEFLDKEEQFESKSYKYKRFKK
jgi:hypothetical protein